MVCLGLGLGLGLGFGLGLGAKALKVSQYPRPGCGVVEEKMVLTASHLQSVSTESHFVFTS